MALTNYSDLSGAIASWLHRTDQTTRITAELIVMAETKINAQLRSRDMESLNTLSTTQDSDTSALPTGFIESKGLWIYDGGTREELYPFDPSDIGFSTSSGRPKNYGIIGSNVVYDCPLDQAYTIKMLAILAYNLASTTTNNIMTKDPGCYLYGALTEGMAFLRDKEMMPFFAVKEKEAFDNAKSRIRRYYSRDQLSVDSALLDNGYYGREYYSES